MADRRAASTHRKVPQFQLQQQKRARNLVALVPKAGARSEADSSDDSALDELHNYIPRTHSDSSSLPPSLPSSLENLNLFSDSDVEMTEVIESASQINPTPCPSTNGSFCVPSPVIRGRLQTRNPSSPSSTARSSTRITNAPPPPPSYCVSSPKPSTSDNNVPSPLASTSSYSVPSPAAATRSKRPQTLVVKKKRVKPKQLTMAWRYQKFTGTAQIEDTQTFLHEERSPIEYFKQLFSDDMISLIVHETNLYSTQTRGSSIRVTEEDIKDFIAINILMGMVKMPAYTDYWSQKFRYEKIADIMPLKKFQLIRRYLHFNDNIHDDGDRYYKIRPFLQTFRENCLHIDEESRFSIDEMMVPYKGTRAGSRRQYIKNKPKKWGFKIFVRAGVSGVVYDFLVYGGEDTFRHHDFTDEEESMGLGAKVVLALAKTIRQPACKILCFDNFFTSIELITHLRNEYGIFSLGTIRQNRLRGAQEKLPTDKILKKRGRGSHAQVVCNKHKAVVLKWYDNKCVTAASTYVDANPIETTLRYSKVTKNKIPVRCPRMIKEYNANMGGVDLADMLVALYRTELRGHRWYLPLFSQVLDIAVNNAWLLYRRARGKQEQIPLKHFRYELYKSLLQYQRAENPTDKSSPAVARVSKNPAAERPVNAIRYDRVDHLPQFSSKGRCKYCIKNQTKFYCQKCNVRLCIVENRNCFRRYHVK